VVLTLHLHTLHLLHTHLLLTLLLLLTLHPMDAVVPQANVAVNGIIAVLDLRTVELVVKAVHVLALVVLTLHLHTHLLLTLLLLHSHLFPLETHATTVLMVNVAANGVIAVLDLRTVDLDVKVELVLQLVRHRALSPRRKALPFHLYKLVLL